MSVATSSVVLIHVGAKLAPYCRPQTRLPAMQQASDLPSKRINHLLCCCYLHTHTHTWWRPFGRNMIYYLKSVCHNQSHWAMQCNSLLICSSIARGRNCPMLKMQNPSCQILYYAITPSYNKLLGKFRAKTLHLLASSVPSDRDLYTLKFVRKWLVTISHALLDAIGHMVSDQWNTPTYAAHMQHMPLVGLFLSCLI